MQGAEKFPLPPAPSLTSFRVLLGLLLTTLVAESKVLSKEDEMRVELIHWPMSLLPPRRVLRLSQSEIRTLRVAASILAKVREVLTDGRDGDSDDDDTDLALAMYELRDLAEAGKYEL